MLATSQLAHCLGWCRTLTPNSGASQCPGSRRHVPRRERAILDSWERRTSLVFEERRGSCHRLTCVRPTLDDSQDVQRLADLIGGVLRSRVACVIVDLSRLRAANSQLVACLVQARRTAGARGVRLLLFALQAVNDWLSVCRVDCLLERWPACPFRTQPAATSDS